jgi:hypothetical protein
MARFNPTAHIATERSKPTGKTLKRSVNQKSNHAFFGLAYIHYTRYTHVLREELSIESPTEEDFNLTASISVIFVLTLLVSYLGFYVSLQVNKERLHAFLKNYFCHR